MFLTAHPCLRDRARSAEGCIGGELAPLQLNADVSPQRLGGGVIPIDWLSSAPLDVAVPCATCV